MRSRPAVFLTIALVLTLGNADTNTELHVPAESAQFASTQPAQDLAWVLAQTGRSAFAAADPAAKDAFVAVMYVAGDLQLAGARHPSVGELTSLIASQRFVDAYARLRATPVRTDQFFVRDVNANGLLSSVAAADRADLVRAEGGRELLLNGDFDGQNMTAAQYDAARADADRRYTRLLNVLLSAANEQSGLRPFPPRSDAVTAAVRAAVRESDSSAACPAVRAGEEPAGALVAGPADRVERAAAAACVR
jgi:hypothetical protein